MDIPSITSIMETQINYYKRSFQDNVKCIYYHLKVLTSSLASHVKQ